jgi:hypothetical protein
LTVLRDTVRSDVTAIISLATGSATGNVSFTAASEDLAGHNVERTRYAGAALLLCRLKRGHDCQWC